MEMDKYSGLPQNNLLLARGLPLAAVLSALRDAGCGFAPCGPIQWTGAAGSGGGGCGADQRVSIAPGARVAPVCQQGLNRSAGLHVHLTRRGLAPGRLLPPPGVSGGLDPWPQLLSPPAPVSAAELKRACDADDYSAVGAYLYDPPTDTAAAFAATFGGAARPLRVGEAEATARFSLKQLSDCEPATARALADIVDTAFFKPMILEQKTPTTVVCAAGRALHVFAWRLLATARSLGEGGAGLPSLAHLTIAVLDPCRNGQRARVRDLP